MTALYPSQRAGPAAASKINFGRTLRSDGSEILGATPLAFFAKVVETPTAHATKTTARNHPSYRVKQAANKHIPHFVSARLALAPPRANSAKYSTAQMKNARYSDSPIAVPC